MEKALEVPSVGAPPRAATAALPPSATSPLSAPPMEPLDPSWCWSRYEPSPAQPWNAALAAHLYRRAGFGATAGELRRAVELGPRATLDDLLRAPSGWAVYDAGQAAREAASARAGDSSAFQAWWLRRLIESPFPLLEKLTLFWHDHFAIGAAKTGDLALFQTHVRMVRACALGNVRALMASLMDDPAMYVALDGDQNRRAKPNLTFARPWLHRFSVGNGVGTDQDVEGVARAFTGWFVYGGQLRFIEREHDGGNWTILGRSGPFGRDELLHALLEHPATALNLARGLFRWFISETAMPGDELLRPLAESLMHSERMREPLELILSSNIFFSRHALGQKIKSPVDLAVGIARSLQTLPPGQALARDLGNLGQRLDEPPTVRGWPAGCDWINTITLAGRVRLSRDLVGASGGYGKGVDPWRLAAAHGAKTTGEAVKLWLEVLLQDQVSSLSVQPLLPAAAPIGTDPAAVLSALTEMVSLPEFQIN